MSLLSGGGERCGQYPIHATPARRLRRCAFEDGGRSGLSPATADRGTRGSLRPDVDEPDSLESFVGFPAPLPTVVSHASSRYCALNSRGLMP